LSVVKESRRQGAKIVSLFQARKDSKEFTLILHFEAPLDTKTGRWTASDHRVTRQTIFPLARIRAHSFLGILRDPVNDLTIDKNKRTLSPATSRAFLSKRSLRIYTRDESDGTATNARVREISWGESPVDGLAGPEQFRIHSEMHSASFQSAAHIETHNRCGRQLCRAQTAADYSAFTDYAVRAPSRRSVPAQYRGGVARIMTDGGDVINGGLLLFYRRTRRGRTWTIARRNRRHSDGL